MNIKLSHVISDLTGVYGPAIVDAMPAGERDLGKLAKLRHNRVRASEETIIKSLEGDLPARAPDRTAVFAGPLPALPDADRGTGQEDGNIHERLPDRVDMDKFPLPPWRKRSRQHEQHNAPAFDLRSHCYRIPGVDPTAVDGFDEVTAHMVVTEAGADFSA